MRFPMVYVLLACLGGCLSYQTYSHISKIVGGNYVFISTAPYMVQIRFRGKHHCGGAIISPVWVLTAAHCFQICADKCLQQYRVLSGSSWRSLGTVHRISRVILHESYEEFLSKYDIALMKVSKSFKIGKGSVKAARLPENGSTPKEGTMARIAGWGKTSEVSSWLPILLSVVNVPIFDKKKCRRYYKRIGIDITDHMICAGYEEGGRDACQGDSGGPLIVKNVLVGVVSVGYGCAQAKFPGVYSDVGYFRKWIRIKTGI